VRAVALRVLAENGFEARSKPADEEAARLEDHVTPSKDVRDMREVAWSSIDNETSRDLDQIEALEETKGGGAKIFVGIADVDAFVRTGTALDKHASRNTTSLYTGTDIFPMLPERLSTDLTSLLPDRDRYAVVTEVIVDGEGNVTSGDVYRAVVRNHQREPGRRVGRHRLLRRLGSEREQSRRRLRHDADARSPDPRRRRDGVSPHARREGADWHVQHQHRRADDGGR